MRTMDNLKSVAVRTRPVPHIVATGRVQRHETSHRPNVAQLRRGQEPALRDETWRPEPCGLSRHELRSIVADMLG
jgi:hypothetical protein